MDVSGKVSSRLLGSSLRAGTVGACVVDAQRMCSYSEPLKSYGTALRQSHEIPDKIAQPEVRRWYARMLIERNAPGDHDKARTLLTEAIAMYRDMGMPKHLEMAEALLSQL